MDLATYMVFRGERLLRLDFRVGEFALGSRLPVVFVIGERRPVNLAVSAEGNLKIEKGIC